VKVAVVNAELPYPPTAGNRIRTLNLLVRLARHHQITFVARRGDPEETRQAIAYLGDHGIRTLVVDHSVPRKSGPAFYARLGANLLSPLPYSVASHFSAPLRRAVRSLAARDTFDIWQAESTPYFPVLDVVPAAPRLIVAHNVESQIWARYFAAETHPARRWYVGQQWRKYERYERRTLTRATRVVAVSPEDARLIREHFGCNRVEVVDNGVDRAYFEAVAAERREFNRILFLGGFDWRPNLDAVSLLLDRIFPEVRVAEPSARLDLVGRRPPESLVRRAAAMEGVELHADVPDVRPYLARSGAMVVPLRIGGGSRLKILEALATGLPVVSTRIGAEGLALVAGRDYIAADEPGDLAQALVAHVRDPGPGLAMARRGRLLVLERYDWDTLAGELGRIWETCHQT
jgi:polysaccharide biosynthesis protein PslH